MKFHDKNIQVAKAFALNFDGQSSKIGDIVLQVNEAMISRASKLPTKGKHWSKTKRVKEML
uniref:Uncharacterized protein n=1 Tax=Picea sitchensis TaxID=3332 RepID=A9NP82_PICSI|nr:unknown [Picea sitchensis]ACN40221.1 unknown [Picea sitchensis]